MTVTLRPHQLRTIEACRAAVRDGRRSPLVTAPCGAGKSVRFSAMARSHVDRGGHVLVCVHRVELLEQAYERLTSFGLTVGAVSPSARHLAQPFARVQVAMVPTLLARGLRPKATMLVADEAHLAAARGWSGLLGDYPDALRLGFSATPARADDASLGGLFDCIIECTTIEELTELGLLVPLRIVSPAKPLGRGEIAQGVAAAYLEHASGRQAMVFSPHVKAAVAHACEFRNAGVSCATITGDMDPFVRRKALADHAAGRIRVLVNVMCLTVGVDSPTTSCVILARSFGHDTLFRQVVGRVLRPSPGKVDALLLDLTGVTHVLGRPDVSREYALDGISKQASTPAGGRLCAVCGAPIPDGSTQCPDCGRAPPELEPPVVVNAPLAKYAGIRRDNDDERATRLAKWLGEARSKGHKEAHAMYRYSAVYAGWPPAHIKRAAMALARGAT